MGHILPDSCLEACSNSYKGLQLSCFSVCLQQSQGRLGDNLPLFVGIKWVGFDAATQESDGCQIL